MKTGWVAVVGPNDDLLSGSDRLIANAIGSPYYSYYGDGDWSCPYCLAYIRHFDLHRDGDNWYHRPCIHKGPIDPPWYRDPVIKTFLYAYHRSHTARPEGHDDIRKLVLTGRKVILIVHSTADIEQLSGQAYGALCFNETDADDLRRSFRRVATIKMPCPPIPTEGRSVVAVNADFVIGWHGQWAPSKGVPLLIEAVHALRGEGLNVGLLAIGAIKHIGPIPLVSSSAYFDHCVELRDRYGLGDAIALINEKQTTADLVATLRQSDAIVLPDYCGSGGSCAAAMTALTAQKPLIVPRLPFYDQLTHAIKLDDASVTGISNMVKTLLRDTGEMSKYYAHCALFMAHNYAIHQLGHAISATIAEL